MAAQKVQVQGVPSAGGAILPLKVTDNADGTGTLKVDTEITATIDPSGLATTANQTALAALIGEVQASPTANTILDRLKDLLTGISLTAGSEVIGSVGVDPRTTTTAALTVAASGDNTAKASPGEGKHLAIYRLVMTVARGSEVNITLKSGSTAKSGAMVADTYDIDFGDSPLVCGTNEAFVVNLSAAVAVTGFLQYIEVTE